MSETMRRLAGLVLLLVSSSASTADAQTFPGGPNPVADPYADIPSCKDHLIFQGETLEATCTDFCAPNATENFDYADSDEDMRYVIRNTVCRCFGPNPQAEAQTNKSFECWSKAEVWDKTTPIMKCTDSALNITSQSNCEEFCSTIDPISYGYSGVAGKSRCSCHDVLVCDDLSSASGMATATVFTLLLGTVFALW